MSNKVVPFTIGHCDLIDPQEFNLENIRNYAYMLESPYYHIYTWIRDGKVLAFYGVNIIDKGIGIAWCTPNRNIYKDRIKFHRNTVKLMNGFCQEELNLHALLMTVRGSFTKGRNWALCLGFNELCCIPNYDGKEAYYLYRRDLWQYQQ